jgi:hypothetical protein
MTEKRELFTAGIFALLLTWLDTLLLRGPFLGALGVILSVFLSILGWFAGTALVRLMSIGIDARSKNYRGRLWTIVVVVSTAIVSAVLLYVFLNDATKTEYSKGEIVIHLLCLFILATLIRTVGYAAVLAFQSQR